MERMRSKQRKFWQAERRRKSFGMALGAVRSRTKKI
jgi:hypothetical protein